MKHVVGGNFENKNSCEEVNGSNDLICVPFCSSSTTTCRAAQRCSTHLTLTLHVWCAQLRHVGGSENASNATTKQEILEKTSYVSGGGVAVINLHSNCMFWFWTSAGAADHRSAAWCGVSMSVGRAATHQTHALRFINRLDKLSRLQLTCRKPHCSGEQSFARECCSTAYTPPPESKH